MIVLGGTWKKSSICETDADKFIWRKFYFKFKENQFFVLFFNFFEGFEFLN